MDCALKCPHLNLRPPNSRPRSFSTPTVANERNLRRARASARVKILTGEILGARNFRTRPIMNREGQRLALDPPKTDTRAKNEGAHQALLRDVWRDGNRPLEIFFEELRADSLPTCG